MSFHVGQKVVCINDTGCRGVDLTVTKGHVYTIRGFLPVGDNLGLYLEEIIRPPEGSSIGVVEWAFHSHRFRPIIERKTDISIFTALLDPSRLKELEPL